MLPQTGERQCKDACTRRTKGDTLQEKRPKERHEDHPSERVASVKVAVSAGGKWPQRANSQITWRKFESFCCAGSLRWRTDYKGWEINGSQGRGNQSRLQTPTKRLARKQRMVRQLPKRNPQTWNGSTYLSSRYLEGGDRRMKPKFKVILDNTESLWPAWAT